MEFVFAVQNETELNRYMQFANQYKNVLSAYLDLLEIKYEVKEVPRCIVLTSEKIATELISEIPVPAYTNDYRIVFVPELNVWRRQYLHQLDAYADSIQKDEIRAFYEERLNERHLLQIIGHELAHHSNFFSDDAYENGGAWFEEGMVEYISSKFFLSDNEFEEQVKISRTLMHLYEQTHSYRPMTLFGDSNDSATIYYDYWRAFTKIIELIHRSNNDEMAVLTRYANNPGQVFKNF
ncbi:MAG: hypothetical protein IKI69_07100 [Oscillospiraceae bacterium]|nr:hypothetical protein [Oscillospiraceae bacterium]